MSSGEADYGKRVATVRAQLMGLARRLCALAGRPEADADDVLNEAAASMLEHADDYRHVENLGGLMARTIKNEVFDLGRKDCVRRESQLDETAVERIAAGGSAEGHGEGDEGGEPWWLRLGTSQIDDAMEELDPDLRGFLVLREREHLTYEAIAARTGLTVNAASGAILRARRKLGPILERKLGPSGGNSRGGGR